MKTFLNKHILKPKKLFALMSLTGLIIIALSSPLSAQSVTQGYSADSVLQRGMVVSLSENDTSKVEPVNRENQTRIHGVVVAPNDSTFTLSETEEKTYVATVGKFETLVSTEAGTINAGDFVAVSSIPGIAMKAGERDAFTVGKAVEVFDGSEAIFNETLTNTLGDTQQVAIKRIIVDVSVGPNPLLRPEDSTLPEFLKSATEAIAGKKVSAVRVYIGLVIIAAASGVSGSLLFSGVRSAVISIGRNPLSKKSVTRSVIQIVVSSIIIFLIGLFGVYLLLRL